MRIDIYTAASIRGPRRRNGHGAYLVKVSDGQEWQRSFTAPIVGATENEAELFVLARAARYASKISGFDDAAISVHTDAGYVISNWYQVKTWRSAGWRNSKGKEIAHQELWELIDELLLSRATNLIRDEDAVKKLRRAAEEMD